MHCRQWIKLWRLDSLKPFKLKRLALILAITILSIPVFSQSDSEYYAMLAGMYKNAVPLINTNDLKELIESKKDIFLLDTREPSEYKVSHLKNAIPVGYNNFKMKLLAGIPKDATIVVYCSVGYRSELIGEKLLKAGYRNTFNLYGGIFEWVNTNSQIVDLSDNLTSKIHPYDKEWGKWLKKGIKAYE
jgi:rhodanese-related sulfurtransferase